MAPKHKSSDAGNLGVPSLLLVLPLSEKVEVLGLIRKGKKSYAEVAETCTVRTKLLSMKL